MTLVVRLATAADASLLEQMFRAVVAPLDLYVEAARAEELATHDAAHFAGLIDRDPFAVAIASLDGEPCGFGIIEEQHGPIWLDWYGVLPEARGHGVGEQLMQFVLAEARRRSATRVWCDTRTENLASNALLEKLGFNRLCSLPNHWHGQDYLLWERSPI